MKRLVLLLVLASLLVACESNPGPRPYPRYDSRYDDTGWECEKVRESGGWSAGADFTCPR